MPPDPAENPTYVEVAEGVHVRQAIDNLTWIDVGNALVVVDALEEAHLADEVLALIDKTAGGKPVRWLLNTHTHYDHVALNPVFRQRYGCEVVDNAAGDLPADGRWFEGPARRVGFLPMGGCHTREDCIVWVPDVRVLCIGDIFGWGLIPLVRALNDETAALLTETYERLIAMAPAVVIGGHGPLLGTVELQRWVAYFHWLIASVQASVERGDSDEQITAELPPPDDMRHWWRFVQWKHADSVGKVISAVRRGRLTL